MQWSHSYSPTPQKSERSLPSWKTMQTIFWDEKRYLKQGKIITSETHCDTLQKASQSNQKQAKRCGLLTKGVFFHNDNTWPHTAARTVQLHLNIKWKILKHPWYNFDIASSEGQYHLIQHLKNWLGSKSLDDGEELKEAVADWLKA